METSNDKATITVSGINLFWDNEWYVPFDHINRNPPYNGATDHLIFRYPREPIFIGDMMRKFQMRLWNLFIIPIK